MRDYAEPYAVNRLCLSMRNVRDYHPLKDYRPVATSYVTLLACSCLLLHFLQLSVALLKRHQQAWGMYYSGFNQIRWVHVHAIKKWIRVKNESGFRQTIR